MMPEHKSWLRPDPIDTIRKRQVARLGGRTSQLVRTRRPVILQGGSLREPQGVGEGGRLRGEFRPKGRRLVDCVTPLLGTKQKPGGLPERQPVQDQDRLAARDPSPEPNEGLAGPGNDLLKGVPDIPGGAGKHIVQLGQGAVPSHDHRIYRPADRGMEFGPEVVGDAPPCLSGRGGQHRGEEVGRERHHSFSRPRP